MTTIYHTPIVSSPEQPANAATFNAPLAELDAALETASGTASGAFAALRADLGPDPAAPYATIQERLDALALAGSSTSFVVAAPAAGENVAGQPVIKVVSSTGAINNDWCYVPLTAGGAVFLQILSFTATTITFTANLPGNVTTGVLVSASGQALRDLAEAVQHSATVSPTPATALALVAGAVTYYPEAYGCTADGATDDAVALDALLNTAIGGVAATVVLDKAYKIANTTTPTSVNEAWELYLTGTPSGGTFTVTVNGQTTAAQLFNESAANLQADLEGLASVGADNVIVARAGTAPNYIFTVTFIGALAHTHVAVTCTSSLTGTTPNIFPILSTRAAVLTVPANVKLQMLPGGSLVLPTGVIVGINGPFDAGLYQVFACTGTGNVAFADGKLAELYPQWWGAVATTATTYGAANSSAFSKAIDAAPNAGIKIAVTGPFVLNTGLQVPVVAVEPTYVRDLKPITLEGYGLSIPENFSGTQRGQPALLFNNASASTVMLDLTAGNTTTTSGNVRFRGAVRKLGLLGNWFADPGVSVRIETQIGIKADWITYASFDRVSLMGFGTGMLVLSYAYYSRFDGCTFRYNGLTAGYGFRALYTLNGTSFNGCQFSTNTGVGFRAESPGKSFDLKSCWIEGNSSYGIYLSDFALATIENCYFEVNGTADIYGVGVFWRWPKLVLSGNVFHVGDRYAVIAYRIGEIVSTGNNYECYNTATYKSIHFTGEVGRLISNGDAWNAQGTLAASYIAVTLAGGRLMPSQYAADSTGSTYLSTSRLGDEIINSAPTIGAERSWICVEPGAGTVPADPGVTGTVQSGTFTVNTTTNVLTVSAGYVPVNGNMVRLSTTTTLPAPLAAATTYYVRDASGQTCKLALTQVGAAIDITTEEAAGTHTLISNQLLLSGLYTNLNIGSTIQVNAGGLLTFSNGYDYATVLDMWLPAGATILFLDAVPTTVGVAGTVTLNHNLFWGGETFGTNRKLTLSVGNNSANCFMGNYFKTGIVAVVAQGYPEGCGIMAFDDAGPTVAKLAGGSKFAVATGALSGTTGSVGNLTVSFVDAETKLIKVENRLGATASISIRTMEGFA